MSNVVWNLLCRSASKLGGRVEDLLRLAPAAALLLLSACPAKQGAGEGSSAKESASPKASGSAATSAGAAASSTAPKAPPPPPSPVDLDKKVWSDGKTTLALEQKDLSKSCLLKGVSMMVPEKASIKPLMGSRGCVIRPFGEDGPYLFVVNDELNFKMTPREEMKGIKRVVEETADSWLVESDDAKTGFVSRVTKKLGDHVHWCTGNSNGKPEGEQIARGFLKLCGTMTYTAP